MDEPVDEKIKLKWTEAGIAALKPTGQRTEFRDPETGMTLLMTPAGAKTFYLVYHAPPGGRRAPKRWFKLGRFGKGCTLDKARKAYKKHAGEVTDGIDPQLARKTKRGARTTVKELCQRFEVEYLDGGKVAASTAVGYKQHIKAHIIPDLGTLVVSEIGSAKVAEFLEGIPKRGQRDKVRATLSRLFSRAELWEMRPKGSNPVIGQDKAEATGRKIRATEAQMKAIGEAIKASRSWQLRALVTTLACTGMRVSELAGNEPKKIPPRPWADVDLAANVIRLSYHKTVKEAGVKTVYLCPEVVAYLKHLPREDNLVLAGWKRAQHAWREMCDGLGIKGLNLHDLRHTFASIGDDLGFSSATVGALLGHAAGSQTQKYTHKLSKDLQVAAAAIGGRMAILLGL